MLAVIRIIIFVFFLIFSTLAGLLICLVRPFHPNNVMLFGHWYGSMANILGIEIEIRRDAAVDPEQSYVFIANHQNSLDLFAMSKAVLPRTVTIGKKSLRWLPFFGQLYWLSGNILIDRDNKNKALGTMQQAAKRIRNDRLSVWMFPEGTRSYGKGLLPFKMGAFHIALQAKVPVVPVCMSTTHQQLKLNRWNNGKIIIEFLPPVELNEQHNLRQFADSLHKQMKDHIAALDAELAQQNRNGKTAKG